MSGVITWLLWVDPHPWTTAHLLAFGAVLVLLILAIARDVARRHADHRPVVRDRRTRPSWRGRRRHPTR